MPCPPIGRGANKRRRIAVLTQLLRCERLEDRTVPSGSVGGRVFQDFDANGRFDTTAAITNSGGIGSVGVAVDRGLAGVVVTAYDPSNAVAGTASTVADGTYTLNAGGTYVYQVDPTTLQFGAAPAFQFQWNYPRGNAEAFNGTGTATWQPWSPTYKTVAPSPTSVYCQPMFTGIAFDVDGNMVVGLRDRGGDQTGFFNFSDPSRPATCVAGGGRRRHAAGRHQHSRRPHVRLDTRKQRRRSGIRPLGGGRQ